MSNYIPHEKLWKELPIHAPGYETLCYVICFNQNIVEYEHSDITDNADITVSDIVTSLFKDSVYPKNKCIGP